MKAFFFFDIPESDFGLYTTITDYTVFFLTLYAEYVYLNTKDFEQDYQVIAALILTLLSLALITLSKLLMYSRGLADQVSNMYGAYKVIYCIGMILLILNWSITSYFSEKIGGHEFLLISIVGVFLHLLCISNASGEVKVCTQGGRTSQANRDTDDLSYITEEDIEENKNQQTDEEIDEAIFNNLVEMKKDEMIKELIVQEGDS